VPAAGRVTVDGIALDTRDGGAISDVDSITVTAQEDAELVLVDVAG